MKISIVGLGYYGLPLAQALLLQNHHVLGTTTTEEKVPKLKQLGIETFLFKSKGHLPSSIKNSDILVLNIPPAEEHLDWFKSWNLSPEKMIIFISSTSVYSDQGHVSETSELVPTTSSGKILVAQEKWISETFKHPTILRFGGLLGGGRHPGKVLSGRKNIQGMNQTVNLIHLDDIVGFTLKIIEESKFGEIFNVVSDEHHTKKEFYGEFCQRMNLPQPEFMEDLSVGKKVSNSKMKQIYQLKFPTMLGKSL